MDTFDTQEDAVAQAAQVIQFKVDDEDVETTERELTPREILGLAGLDPDQHYLVLVKGGKPDKSFEQTPNEKIHLHPGIEFASVFTGPTHVS
ncbi:MAG: multiubiquitin domain-containing protein [Gaiellaceae bacterium]